RVDWFPRNGDTYLGLSVPMWSRAGRTRPQDDATWLGPLLTGRPPSPGEPGEAAAAAMHRASQHAIWIGREVAPLIEMEGHDPLQAVAGPLGALQERLAALPAPAHDSQQYHYELDSAFRSAIGGDGARAAMITARARSVMLDA